MRAAADAAGHRSSKALLSVATAPCPDTVAPSSPTNLIATSISATSVTLSWTLSVDNAGVAGYVAIAFASFVFFYPILAAYPIPWDAWHQRMWIDKWIIGPG